MKFQIITAVTLSDIEAIAGQAVVYGWRPCGSCQWDGENRQFYLSMIHEGEPEDGAEVALREKSLAQKRKR